MLLRHSNIDNFLVLWRNKEVCTEFIVMECTLSASVSRAFWLQFLLVLLPLILLPMWILCVSRTNNVEIGWSANGNEGQIQPNQELVPQFKDLQ